jgi:hypothetical protein
MEIVLGKKFKNVLKSKIEDYSFEVGILKDKKRREPISYDLEGFNALKNLYGGTARKTGKQSKTMMSEVSKKWRQKENYLQEPFKLKSNKDVLLFVNNFMRVITDKSRPNRLKNLVQAIIRNPILRGDYGSNSFYAVERKGFNRYMIDTGQFFKAILSRVTFRGKDV